MENRWEWKFEKEENAGDRRGEREKGRWIGEMRLRQVGEGETGEVV